ncbi:MAG TPA: DinB family protein [Gemmatimonadaceae bacterium]|nr:DinB family protein [Gemmatimonadaceae bacterium]
MHSRLAELSDHLAHQRRTLLDVASTVPTERWQTRLSEDAWSVSEILEHLHRVERGAAAVLAKRIAKAREAGHPAETETSSVLGTLDQFRVSDLDRRLVAPELVRPTENPDRGTVEGWLAESRAALDAAIASGDGLALGSIRHTHLRFGELDLYQWLLFVAEHEKRHIAQLREVARQLVPAA